MIELPPQFSEQMSKLLPAEEFEQFSRAMCQPPTVSVRRNKNKSTGFAVESNPVKWCELGKYLDDREQFTFDPLFHSGAYYVQDASSMFLSAAIRSLHLNKAVRYLDLCAAPGGKTTAAIDALPEGSLVVANEIMNNRAQILRENIIKWGNPYCIVTNNDSKSIGTLRHTFDIIAADVPCSGEGMMRKDDEAVSQWTPHLVEECAARQREIIESAWEALRPGGYLIYSTCTYNREENEEMMKWITGKYGAESIKIELSPEWNIREGIDCEGIHCYRFMPHKTRGEGLFMSVVRKPAEEEHPIGTSQRKNKRQATKTVVPKGVKDLLKCDVEWEWENSNGNYRAFPRCYATEYDIICNNLKVIYSGIAVATEKGRDIVPTQQLAMSSEMNCQFATADLTYHEAIAYLRGESISLSCASKGIVLVTFKGHPLGFVKNLGSRANNMYPKEWRIRSSHSPEEAPQIIK